MSCPNAPPPQHLFYSGLFFVDNDVGLDVQRYSTFLRLYFFFFLGGCAALGESYFDAVLSLAALIWPSTLFAT